MLVAKPFSLSSLHQLASVVAPLSCELRRQALLQLLQYSHAHTHTHTHTRTRTYTQPVWTGGAHLPRPGGTQGRPGRGRAAARESLGRGTRGGRPRCTQSRRGERWRGSRASPSPLPSPSRSPPAEMATLRALQRCPGRGRGARLSLRADCRLALLFFCFLSFSFPLRARSAAVGHRWRCLLSDLGMQSETLSPALLNLLHASDVTVLHLPLVSFALLLALCRCLLHNRTSQRPPLAGECSSNCCASDTRE